MNVICTYKITAFWSFKVTKIIVKRNKMLLVSCGLETRCEDRDTRQVHSNAYAVLSLFLMLYQTKTYKDHSVSPGTSN